MHSQKQMYKYWKRLIALCRRWCCCWWLLLLEMLKKHLCVIRSLSCGKRFLIQQYGIRCHTANSVPNYLNENVYDYIRKEKWSPNSCDLNLLDYAIWTSWKRYSMGYGIDWENISSIIQSTNGGCDWKK